MDIRVTSYNMQGFNQGENFIPSLADKSDVIFIQETGCILMNWAYLTSVMMTLSRLVRLLCL